MDSGNNGRYAALLDDDDAASAVTIEGNKQAAEKAETVSPPPPGTTTGDAERSNDDATTNTKASASSGSRQSWKIFPSFDGSTRGRGGEDPQESASTVSEGSSKSKSSVLETLTIKIKDTLRDEKMPKYPPAPRV